MKLDISVVPHGDVVEVYSAAMRCNYPIRPAQLKESLQRLVSDWIDLQEINGASAEAGPYNLMIGGLKIEECHSTKQFDSAAERELYWRTTTEPCWLPVGNAWLRNTDENVIRQFELSRALQP